MEIEEEGRQRKEEFEHLRHTVTTTMHDGGHVRRQDLSKKILDFQAEVEKERSERQTEDQSLHQLINTLAEQTDLVIEEEASRLWEAFHTHNHDVIIEDVQIQTSSKPSGPHSRHPRRIQHLTNSFASYVTPSPVTSLPPRAASTGPSRHK